MLWRKLRILAEAIGFGLILLFVANSILTLFMQYSQRGIGRIFAGTSVSAETLQQTELNEITLSSGSITNAGTEHKLDFHGTVRTGQGSLATGDYDIVVRIYEAADRPVGSEVWSEVHHKIVIQDGSFTLSVGSNSALPESFFSGRDIFLGIEIVGYPESVPRVTYAPTLSVLPERTLPENMVFPNQTTPAVQTAQVTQPSQPLIEKPNDTNEVVHIDLSVPGLIGYNGVLKDKAGNLLNQPYTMTFRIYDDISKPVNGAIWSETHGQVAVENGIFSVMLGSLTPFPTQVFSSTTRYIGIQLQGDGAEMSPRQRLISVPFAVEADSAAWADTAGKANLATKATTATWADGAGRANSAATADNATNADKAKSADYATSAGSASYASSAGTLWGFWIEEAYGAWAVNGGEIDYKMIATGKRFCYLAKVDYSAIGNNGEHAICRVYRKDNFWYLYVYAGPNNSTENGASCDAICISW